MILIWFRIVNTQFTSNFSYIFHELVSSIKGECHHLNQTIKFTISYQVKLLWEPGIYQRKKSFKIWIKLYTESKSEPKGRVPFCACDRNRWIWTRCGRTSQGEAWGARPWVRPPPRWFLPWSWSWFPSFPPLASPSSPPTRPGSGTTLPGEAREWCNGAGFWRHWMRIWGLKSGVFEGRWWSKKTQLGGSTWFSFLAKVCAKHYFSFQWSR